MGDIRGREAGVRGSIRQCPADWTSSVLGGILCSAAAGGGGGGGLTSM